jgi:FkbM family methyltransferase
MNFTEVFLKEFLNAVYSNYRPLFDQDTCLPLCKKWPTKLKDLIADAITAKQYVRRKFDVDNAIAMLTVYTNHIAELSRIYDLLSDDYSKQVFIKVLLYRIVGPLHVRLPLFYREYIKEFHGLGRYRRRKKLFKLDSFEFDEFVVPGRQENLEMALPGGGILMTFLLEQYAYRRSGVAIEAKPGDVAIDGGACWGDTMLYLADKVGNSGQVWAFEFIDRHLEILDSNIRRNAALSHRIKIMPNALYSESGKELSFVASGPGSRILHDQNARPGPKISTVSIDDLREREKLHSVDFIKLDIEGAELPALKGAARTLKECLPDLAIAAYHQPQDMWELPLYIQSLNCGYSFYLDHFAPNSWETVLYAKTRK